MSVPSPIAPEGRPAPLLVPPALVLRVWLGLGFQSFGGGAVTLTLIRQAVVERYGWLSEAEFVRDWSLCQLAPGINLLGLTILIGRRLAGLPGIFLALLGLLLPSVTLTVLITACYVHFRGRPPVQAALRGVIPATVGLGLLTAGRMARPLLGAGRRAGAAGPSLGMAILIGSGLSVALWHAPTLLVLCAAGAAGALAQWGTQAARERARR